ncbi:hypothetical protein WN48_05609 [Eufriesea mexicana]|uniref:Uncharacterized protein n=1 Tax=Eufriesea mexicana TaxID=516756 RepID=A0A310SCN0_9HYME|nr:hypothetical protein WN48_05609 [Eufriesea mexicana]
MTNRRGELSRSTDENPASFQSFRHAPSAAPSFDATSISRRTSFARLVQPRPPAFLFAIADGPSSMALCSFSFLDAWSTESRLTPLHAFSGIFSRQNSSSER